MSLEFRLDAFEGPLDLLLLLIEKNKVDIYDIPIALITDQYMEYVSAMQEERDLDVLSDFLVMASTLLDLKARMLLPRERRGNRSPGGACRAPDRIPGIQDDGIEAPGVLLRVRRRVLS